MMLTIILMVVFCYQVHAQNQGTCKSPYVEQRLLADDVRYASPFYVIALPRNPRTEQMDNVCYTYFENNQGGFFHIMSITFKNGTNTYYQYSKGDILDRTGIAEAKALTDSECTYHDYTLKPICNVSVFILYRCFIQGNCGNIDIGVTPGVDVRVTLAASPQISPECRRETEASLKDTSALAGGNYVILPQKLAPQCITKYNNMISIGHDRARGSKEVSEDTFNRFGDDTSSQPAPYPKPMPTQNTWNQNSVKSVPAYNPYGTQIKPHTNNVRPPVSGSGAASSTGYAYSYSNGQTNSGNAYGTSYSTTNSQTQRQPLNNGQWNSNPPQWNGQTIAPGADVHYHVWQSAAAASVMKTMTGKSPNIHYHVHSWENTPPGCCKCN